MRPSQLITWPLIMKISGYHSSKSNNLTRIDPDKLTGSDYGVGFYLSSTLEGSYGYGPYTYKIEADLKNPFLANTSPSSTEEAQKIFNSVFGPDESDPDTHPFIELSEYANFMGSPGLINKALKKQGYDGIIISHDLLSMRPGPGLQPNTDYIVIFNLDAITNISPVNKENFDEVLEKAIISTLKKRPYQTQRDLFYSLGDTGVINISSMSDSMALIEAIKKLVGAGSILDNGGYYEVEF